MSKLGGRNYSSTEEREKGVTEFLLSATDVDRSKRYGLSSKVSQLVAFCLSKLKEDAQVCTGSDLYCSNLP